MARGKPDQLISVIVNDVVAENRVQWAERFVLMGMWCQAASDAKQRRMARGLVTTAFALVNDTPLTEIPAMTVIAVNTLEAEATGSW